MNLYDVANELGSILQAQNLNVVTAESCTGGWVAQAITAIPGSSLWFQQGWVTYSNESKTKELGVPAELINKHGAVSDEVVTAMSSGALLNSGADVAIATSGVAGPDGGTVINPVGTVWIAIAFKLDNQECDVQTWRLSLDGDRKSIREQTVYIVLIHLIDILRGR